MSWARRLGLPHLRMGWRWVRYDAVRAQALLHHPHGLWAWVSTVYPPPMRDQDLAAFDRGLRQAVRDRLRGLCLPFAERLPDGRERFWLEEERVRYTLRADTQGLIKALEQAVDRVNRAAVR